MLDGDPQSSGIGAGTPGSTSSDHSPKSSTRTKMVNLFRHPSRSTAGWVRFAPSGLSQDRRSCRLETPRRAVKAGSGTFAALRCLALGMKRRIGDRHVEVRWRSWARLDVSID